MPLSSLSDQERLRLAELLQAPLIPPPVADKPSRKTWPAHWKQWACGLAAGVACLLTLAVAVKLGRGSEAHPIRFQALDRQGQLQIRWDPQSDAIRRATDARLYITDGEERVFVDLDTGLLRRGVVSYARESDLVNLRLALTEPGGRLVEQGATFFGAPPDADGWRLESVAEPAAPATPIAADPVPTAIGHRARIKPLVQSGRNLPFTCAAGDIFHKTDAAPGWDTFTCRGKNVWSISTRQLGDDHRSASRSGAARVTAKPDHAATTL